MKTPRTIDEWKTIFINNETYPEIFDEAYPITPGEMINNGTLFIDSGGSMYETVYGFAFMHTVALLMTGNNENRYYGRYSYIPWEIDEYSSKLNLLRYLLLSKTWLSKFTVSGVSSTYQWFYDNDSPFEVKIGNHNWITNDRDGPMNIILTKSSEVKLFLEALTSYYDDICQAIGKENIIKILIDYENCNSESTYIVNGKGELK